MIIGHYNIWMGVMTLRFKYSATVCSDIDMIKNFVDEILNRINPVVKDKDIMFDIKLILNELIVNGVMHGNQCINSKCVKLLLEVENDQVKIQVEDEGQGVNYDFKSYNPEELNFCGRGLVIVSGLSDEFYIEKNRVIAVKNIG